METRRKSLNKDRISFDKNVNLGLWLDKFIEGQDNEKKDGERFKSQIVNQATQIKISDAYEKFFDLRQDCLNEIQPNICKAIEVDSRMIIGLGGESIWENAISIHRTYGVPFIPGSTLKGVTANYARKFLKDFDQNGEAYKFIFGSQESAGFITFHDALLCPETAKIQFLHADIMTVHHQNYYSDKKDKEANLIPPADWDSPNPINFVSASGKYQLVLTSVEDCENWLNIVVEILTHALQDEGVGAKTSSGYGRADLTDNFHKTKKMEEAEKEQKRFEEERKRAEFERQQDEARLAEEKLKQEKRLAYEAEQLIKAAQEQQNEVSRTQRIYEQIKQINAKTKKIEKEFEKISGTIYKIQDTEQKKRLTTAALEKIEQMQNENVKVDVSRKWYSILKKMGGVN
jgi:CRISPR-associated protein Cmr6